MDLETVECVVVGRSSPEKTELPSQRQLKKAIMTIVKNDDLSEVSPRQFRQKLEKQFKLSEGALDLQKKMVRSLIDAAISEAEGQDESEEDFDHSDVEEEEAEPKRKKADPPAKKAKRKNKEQAEGTPPAKRGKNLLKKKKDKNAPKKGSSSFMFFSQGRVRLGTAHVPQPTPAPTTRASWVPPGFAFPIINCAELPRPQRSTLSALQLGSR